MPHALVVLERVHCGLHMFFRLGVEDAARLRVNGLADPRVVIQRGRDAGVVAVQIVFCRLVCRLLDSVIPS
eukprot:479549-Rhodomonas_salina.2